MTRKEKNDNYSNVVKYIFSHYDEKRGIIIDLIHGNDLNQLISYISKIDNFDFKNLNYENFNIIYYLDKSINNDINTNIKNYISMGKILLAGVGGNLGSEAAKILLTLEDKNNLIFCSSHEETLKKYTNMGIETHVVDFNYYDNLEEVFRNVDTIGLISMPFVGEKRQAAHKNVIDAAKSVGVKKIVYTSLVNASDETNPSIEKLDHDFTEKYIKSVGMNYIFLRLNIPFSNNSGDGHMAYISRKDCAKALAIALHKANKYDHTTIDINGKELLSMKEFIEIGNKVTGNHVTYREISDEENYKELDAQGVPRTTDGIFATDAPTPFCSDGIVSFGKAIRLEKFAIHTNDFKKLTGDDPIPVSYMFANSKDFEIGERHSKDKK
ncbi:NAD(P)-binding protein [Anaeromyces robustus]|uniref:NAD(P)-binding protein n=1 Tax=Anaeromyces robustus TaxID=1754192 RepID=A0A1Y1X0X1_9FUNG|nr:NAD(P)-binding protein [Anaeromyces robustus]|eukprot:ORX78984.1 NAD(P)-binding protein [Anaeromyces robustus]